tara:strand:+ start:923 stop:1540 length:618 start_codon:yes stop_codon:yes gene_type:complete
MAIKIATIRPVETETTYADAICEARTYYVRNAVWNPVTYLTRLEQWTDENQRKHLHWPSVVRSARLCAERLADSYRDSGCGFGSSDGTYEMMNFLRECGFLVAFVKCDKGYERGTVIGKRQHFVGWSQTATIDEKQREPLDFFGPCKNFTEGWKRVSAWRQSERAKPDFAEKHGDCGTPRYFFDIQVLSTTDHRYPGFEDETPRW